MFWSHLLHPTCPQAVLNPFYCNLLVFRLFEVFPLQHICPKTILNLFFECLQHSFSNVSSPSSELLLLQTVIKHVHMLYESPSTDRPNRFCMQAVSFKSLPCHQSSPVSSQFLNQASNSPYWIVCISLDIFLKSAQIIYISLFFIQWIGALWTIINSLPRKSSEMNSFHNIISSLAIYLVIQVKYLNNSKKWFIQNFSNLSTQTNFCDNCIWNCQMFERSESARNELPLIALAPNWTSVQVETNEKKKAPSLFRHLQTSVKLARYIHSLFTGCDGQFN